ncbi:hypothetical protein H696_05147 [Fonticula alba]|uniref:Uncharacterized protein n=1 Tax=Fonticula alba TaxID=691883 RepID=A0A058Z3W3_FONAL|nr:hypothetical protein H696_05147 [Fonticula alba]KCV68222.1 hypothetical protein H696_05147 [Fonticula alba]|eukprot:XP_009497276.1 hypothetical protein H696_05147 [Fonticula alba]
MVGGASHAHMRACTWRGLTEEVDRHHLRTRGRIYRMRRRRRRGATGRAILGSPEQKRRRRPTRRHAHVPAHVVRDNALVCFSRRLPHSGRRPPRRSWAPHAQLV